MYDLLRQRQLSSVSASSFHQTLAPYPADLRATSEPELPQTTQRPLQPRPPRSTDSPVPATTNGEGFRILRPFATSGLEGERRRKRGRPTKEEAEERDRRLAESGQTYEPKKRPAKKARPSEVPSLLAESPLSTSPTMSTPFVQHQEAQEPTSSGKRRVRRQREGEEAQQPRTRSPQDSSGDGQSTDPAQSPSDRLLARPERAQAVASIARALGDTESAYNAFKPDPGRDEQQRGPPSI
jgi:hypothetical protein